MADTDYHSIEIKLNSMDFVLLNHVVKLPYWLKEEVFYLYIYMFNFRV